MNILPKKRWHVRTKDNIARVRKDEAAAREEEEKRKKQLEIAESEARINFLRLRSGFPTSHVREDDKEEPVPSGSSSQLERVDLFADYKSHIKTTNKELEKEKKEEQEKYEKQIGYLTYLGQDTNEALKLRSWYEIAPKRRRKDDTEINEKELKIKQNHDPLTLMKALLPAEHKVTSKLPIEFVKETSSTTTIKKKKHKKEKKHKKDKHKKHSRKHSDKKKKKMDKQSKDEAERQRQKKKLLERLRQERLRRETVERARQEALLKPMATPGEEEDTTTKGTNADATPRVKQKYNSQFNPEIAKQNM